MCGSMTRQFLILQYFSEEVNNKEEEYKDVSKRKKRHSPLFHSLMTSNLTDIQAISYNIFSTIQSC